MRRKSSVVFFVLVIFMRCTVNGEESERKENSLLPRSLIPLEYTLLFEIDMADEMNLFTGTATIKIQFITTTNEIILNVKDLEIDENDVEVTKESVSQSKSCFGMIPLPRSCFSPKNTSSTETMPLLIEEQRLDEDRERYKIVLKNDIEENEVVTVFIKYRKSSSLQHPGMAFIKYSYRKEPNGEEKWLAVSRSGAIHARRLYPCIDERHLSAPVIVMISHHEDLISLSNTLLEKDGTSVSTTPPNFIVEKYQPTNHLSTFSIGLVVGNLIENPTPESSLSNDVRIWVDKSVVGHEAYSYATIAASTIFKYYYEYFGSSRSGCQIDIVAIPNYGYTDKWMLDLITIDESVITSLDPWKPIRNVEIAFQLCDIFSHQYFGPQTTIKNWTDNWLNMGLALYFRTPCFEQMFSDEKSSLVIINQTESFIRISDAEPGRIFHPLTLTDSQINLNTLFENSALADIAYSLVRMLNSIVSWRSEDILHEGVKQYIADSKTKVFNLKDIVGLFQRGRYSYPIYNGATLLTIMDSWTSTNAFAIVELTRDEGESSVTVTQKPLETDNGGKIYKYIPLIYSTKSYLSDRHNQQRVLMWLNDQSKKIPYVEDDEWVIHLSRLDVLCRYVYDKSILILIEETLSDEGQYTIIPDLARAQLISDLFAIAEMEEYPDYTYSMVFKILKYLEHERALPPLMVALHEFNKIRLRLLGSNAFSVLQDYVQHILQKIIDAKQYENISQFGKNDYTEYYLKKLIVASACTFQVKSCVDQSTNIFNKWLVDSLRVESEGGPKINSPFPEIVRQYTYCQAIRTGGEQEWNFLWKLYDKTNVKKSDDILNALACTTDREQLKEYLNRSIDAGKTAVEDSLTVFKSVGTNVKGYLLMFEFLQEYFEEILAVHKDNLSNVHFYWKLLYEITWNRTDFNTLENYTNFVKSSVENLESNLEESREKAEKNILWLENKVENISSFRTSWREQDKEDISVKG